MGFEPEELPKFENYTDQSDLEKQKQNTKEAKNQIETVY